MGNYIFSLGVSAFSFETPHWLVYSIVGGMAKFPYLYNNLLASHPRHISFQTSHLHHDVDVF